MRSMGWFQSALLLAFAGPLAAQEIESLRLYSEFQRIDPFGNVVTADRGQASREIISPGIARGGYFTLHVAVTGAPKAMFFLAVQANPPDVLRWKLYREQYTRKGEEWVPEGLTELRPPYFSTLASPEIENQTTQSYLVDVFVPAETAPGRLRLEVLAKTDTWWICPMEVRVLPAVIPPHDVPAAATISAVLRRNARQDEELAKRNPGLCSGALGDRTRMGAEAYLVYRDCLFRQTQ